MPENRDPEVRRASKKAFYERNKERLREKARQRARDRRRDEAVREQERKASDTYRFMNREKLRRRRLNEYRMEYIRAHGIDAFKEEFKGRAKMAPGTLLEHLSEGQLRAMFGHALSTPTYE